MSNQFSTFISNLKQKPKSYYFNFFVMILFCFSFIQFKNVSFLSIPFRNPREIEYNPFKKIDSTNYYSTKIYYGRGLEAKIMDFINSSLNISVQNPNCDFKCANDCLTSKTSKNTEINQAYYEICLVDFCSCEKTSVKKNRSIPIFFSIIICLLSCYFVFKLSLEEVNSKIEKIQSFKNYSELNLNEVNPSTLQNESEEEIEEVKEKKELLIVN